MTPAEQEKKKEDLAYFVAERFCTFAKDEIEEKKEKQNETNHYLNLADLLLFPGTKTPPTEIPFNYPPNKHRLYASKYWRVRNSSDSVSDEDAVFTSISSEKTGSETESLFERKPDEKSGIPDTPSKYPR